MSVLQTAPGVGADPTSDKPTGPRTPVTQFVWAALKLWSDVELLARGNRGLVLAHGTGAPLAVMTALSARCGSLCVARVIDEPLPLTREGVFAYLEENAADIHVVLNPDQNIQSAEAWAALGAWARLDRRDRSVPVTAAVNACLACPGRFHGRWPHEIEKDDSDANPHLTGGLLLVAPDVADPGPFLAKLGWDLPLSPRQRNIEVRAVDAPPVSLLPATAAPKFGPLTSSVLLTPAASATVAKSLADAWAPGSCRSCEVFSATAPMLAWLCGMEFKPVNWRGICEEEYEVTAEDMAEIEHEEPDDEAIAECAFCSEDDEWEDAGDTEDALFDPDRLERELFDDLQDEDYE